MNQPRPGDSPIDSQMAAPPVAEPAQNPPPLIPTTSAGGGLASNALLQNKLVVLATLFFVTAALGIPLLWINRKFSPAERILWTIVILIYTAALFIGVGWVLWWSYSQIVGYGN